MTDTTTCPCGVTMPVLTKEGKPRKYCSGSCAGRHPRGPSRWDTLEDVEWLIEQGQSPAAIVVRLGRSAESIAKALSRAERRDLARLFERERRNARGQCLDCGVDIYRTSKRCRPCSNRSRIDGFPVCHKPEHLRSELRWAERWQRKVVRAASIHTDRDYTERLATAAAEVAKNRRNIEWHDANCELCAARRTA